MSIKLQFVYHPNFQSWLITWFSAGKYSHVDCIMEDGTLFGARSDKIGNIPPGVYDRPPNYKIFTRKLVIELPCSEEQEKKFYEFLFLQNGKPYDKTAIKAFFFHRDWRADDSWFCSELIVAALEYAGIILQIGAEVNQITPVVCSIICCVAGGKIIMKVG